MRFQIDSGRRRAALTLIAILAAGAASAAPGLTPGFQVVEGVVVVVDHVARRRTYELVHDSGGTASQSISLTLQEFGEGGAIAKAVRRRAVPKRPSGDPYEDVPRTAIQGDLEGSPGRWRLDVEAIVPSVEARRRELVALWRALVMDHQWRTEGDARAAFRRLEELGVIREMATVALRHRR